MKANESPQNFKIKEMIIRSATNEDIPVLRELFERSRLEGQTRENDTGADIDYLIAGYFECGDSGFWVAQSQECIVGMIGVQRLNDNSAEIRRNLPRCRWRV